MSKELYTAIENLSREKEVDVEVVVNAVEEAVAIAAKKDLASEQDLVSHLDRDQGTFHVYARRRIVETVEEPEQEISLEEAQQYSPDVQVDDVLEFPVEVPALGRIAAQTAKQVIFQKIREAERKIVYGRFISKVGEIVNGRIKGYDKGGFLVDIGRTESLLPKREIPHSNKFKLGDRLRALIQEVNAESAAAQVILSRKSPEFVKKLFEMEVPEVFDGTVQIRAIAREPGERTKIAVQARQKEVDPVGACVGMRGTRVQGIIRELKGERIDIIMWADDLEALVKNTFHPTQVLEFKILDEDQRLLQILLKEEQYAAAIGKKGQNIRLASDLIGWNIQVEIVPMPEPEPEPEPEEEAEEAPAEIEAETEADAEAAADAPAAEEGEETPDTAEAAEAEAEAGDPETGDAPEAAEEATAPEAEEAEAPADGGEPGVDALPDVEPDLIEALKAAGFGSVQSVAGADLEALLAIPALDKPVAEKLIENAQAVLAAHGN